MAPDYVLVHRDVEEALVEELKKAVDEFYCTDVIASGE